MDNNPLRIAITPSLPFPDEALWIRAVIEAGWDFVHLRHPGSTLRDVKAVIEDIPVRYHSRLRLHGHFELLNEFNLGGIHLNSRCPEPPAMYHGATSRTCHSMDEVKAFSGNHDYITLSPIFPSISKPGYSASFTTEELQSLPYGKVVALGGVTPDRLDRLKMFPFKGYAVLGYLFEAENIDDLRQRLDRFNNL